jgi:Nitrate and nitrite sensing/Histidine kinase-, DNA gyrase B-, and HSP90-like ATPase
MSWRIRSINKRVLLLVLVPVLSLFGLFLFTTAITGQNALNLQRARTLKAATAQPVGNFLDQLEAERVFALIYLSSPGSANLARLQAQEVTTGHATAALRDALSAGSTLDNASAGERQATTTLLESAARLSGLHSSIAARTVSPGQAQATYNDLIEDSYLLLNQVILTEPSAPIVAQALALERVGRSADLLQQENSLLLADLAARRFPPADQRAFTELVGARRTLLDQALPELDPAYRGFYRQDVSPRAYAALTSLENIVTGNSRLGDLPAVRPAAWEGAVEGVSVAVERAGNQGADALDHRAEREARVTDLRLLLSGGLGLLAVVASIIISLLFGRGLVRELSALRQSALRLANERLPQLVDQLAVGLDVDLAQDSLVVPAKSREIGQVAEAFAKVQQTAVEAAVGQARLREGIGEVFRNLARRSQSLLHRQLALLDRMERRTEDPEELADLFRIDHLTTRMRRHAESLIILSGLSPARGWRNPVPLVDVLRAAVAEVEDYTRVSVMCAADAALEGPAVGDVIHMIAELIENATIFSPPNTPVVVQGDVVGQGFAVEIEDRGLGLSDDKRAEANHLLAHPLPFDPSHTDQLGLLVGGQLAQRHEIRITLCPNAYGGTTAIVLIPHSVVVAEGFPAQEPARAIEGAGPAKGRHATREENGPAGGGGALPGLPPEAAPAPVAGAAGPEPRPQPYEPALRRSSPGWPAAGLPPATGAAVTDAAEGPLLPRRVRQASLVPQLREGVIPLSSPPGDPTPDGQSPEQTRATMSAIQQGWERGRSAAELSPAASAPFEPASAAGIAPEPGGPAEAVNASAADSGDRGGYRHDPAAGRRRPDGSR